jgi:hypothetical protein
MTFMKIIIRNILLVSSACLSIFYELRHHNLIGKKKTSEFYVVVRTKVVNFSKEGCCNAIFSTPISECFHISSYNYHYCWRSHILPGNI